jgi:hypothetical protein
VQPKLRERKVTGPVFFFSYARTDRRGADLGRINWQGQSENSVDLFYRRLCNHVANLIGGDAKDVGFFDDRHLERGVPWPDHVMSALRSARVMVALFSPVYFSRPACGREFQIFRLRHKALEDKLGRAPDYRLLPVLWARPDVISDSIPHCCREFVNTLQLTAPGMPDSYNKYGLMRMLELSRLESDSNEVCHAVADRIYALTRTDALPQLHEVDFDDVDSAFHEAPTMGSARPIQQEKREVRVYYLVPTRSEWTDATGVNEDRLHDHREKARLFADAPGATVGSATEEGVGIVKPDLIVVHEQLPNDLAGALRETNDSMTTPLVVFDRRSLQIPHLRGASCSYANANFNNTGFVTVAGHEVPDAEIESLYRAKIGSLPKLHSWNVPSGRNGYVGTVASIVNELEMELVRRKTETKSRTGQVPLVYIAAIASDVRKDNYVLFLQGWNRPHHGAGQRCMSTRFGGTQSPGN